MELQTIKRRFDIVGNNPKLNRALETALRVAPTDLSVLITGESGVGKEAVPKIIHSESARKHNRYIAVNCGAIPSGTMDSELFGHIKGSFTGAQSERKGYFEEADGGTLFLDEIAEMPLETQVKLLRVLESGEYIKVGSSKVKTTDVRIIAASNVNIPKAVNKGKFREDLFYRLNTVPISLPPLRERKEDIHLLFRKFAADFSEKFKMPGVRLTDDAVEVLEKYSWTGNVRQLKNITEQISILEQSRNIDKDTLLSYLPDYSPGQLPARLNEFEDEKSSKSWHNEREMLYKVIFELRNEVDDLKSLMREFIKQRGELTEESADLIKNLYGRNTGKSDESTRRSLSLPAPREEEQEEHENHEDVHEDTTHPAEVAREEYYEHQEIEENLNLESHEKELIQKALEKHNNKRKTAAEELGISERTLYRKIKEYDLT